MSIYLVLTKEQLEKQRTVLLWLVKEIELELKKRRRWKGAKD